MRLELKDYVDRQVDPTATFVPLAVHDELLAAMLQDPGAVIPADLQSTILQDQVGGALRLQQHLVYRIGRNLGVLSVVAPKVREALQIVPPLSAAVGDVQQMILEAVSTAIGVASDALGSIPIVGWIVRAVDGGLRLAMLALAALESPGQRIGPQLERALKYSTDADASLANVRVIAESEKLDWTRLFLPSMRGELAACIRNDAAERIVIQWGLADGGKVPRVIIDSRPLLKPYTWHFSEANGGAFSGTEGLGAVPGTPRIIRSVQSTLLEPSVIHRGHESLGDPRCGSEGKTSDVDTGLFYPSTASGAFSLFGYATKPSAAMYTINTQLVASSWKQYCEAIWEGIERLWWNDAWVSGWGCGPWENALQGLSRAHCVGADGQIGSFGAWAPTGRSAKKLTAADRDAFEANNVSTRIVAPAMKELRRLQVQYLEHTPVAAYLPTNDGGQGLGAAADPGIRRAIGYARGRLLFGGGPQSKEVLLTDVLWKPYRSQLEAKKLGALTGDGGMSIGDEHPPRWPGELAGDGLGGGGDGGGGLLVLAGLAAGAWGLRQYLRSRR